MNDTEIFNGSQGFYYTWTNKDFLPNPQDSDPLIVQFAKTYDGTNWRDNTVYARSTKLENSKYYKIEVDYNPSLKSNRNANHLIIFLIHSGTYYPFAISKGNFPHDSLSDSAGVLSFYFTANEKIQCNEVNTLNVNLAQASDFTVGSRESIANGVDLYFTQLRRFVGTGLPSTKNGSYVEGHGKISQLRSDVALKSPQFTVDASSIQLTDDYKKDGSPDIGLSSKGAVNFYTEAALMGSDTEWSKNIENQSLLRTLHSYMTNDEYVNQGIKPPKSIADFWDRLRNYLNDFMETYHIIFDFNLNDIGFEGIKDNEPKILKKSLSTKLNRFQSGKNIVSSQISINSKDDIRYPLDGFGYIEVKGVGVFSIVCHWSKTELIVTITKTSYTFDTIPSGIHCSKIDLDGHAKSIPFMWVTLHVYKSAYKILTPPSIEKKLVTKNIITGYNNLQYPRFGVDYREKLAHFAGKYPFRVEVSIESPGDILRLHPGDIKTGVKFSRYSDNVKVIYHIYLHKDLVKYKFLIDCHIDMSLKQLGVHTATEGNHRFLNIVTDKDSRVVGDYVYSDSLAVKCDISGTSSVFYKYWSSGITMFLKDGITRKVQYRDIYDTDISIYRGTPLLHGWGLGETPHYVVSCNMLPQFRKSYELPRLNSDERSGITINSFTGDICKIDSGSSTSVTPEIKINNTVIKSSIVDSIVKVDYHDYVDKVLRLQDNTKYPMEIKLTGNSSEGNLETVENMEVTMHRLDGYVQFPKEIISRDDQSDFVTAGRWNIQSGFNVAIPWNQTKRSYINPWFCPFLTYFVTFPEFQTAMESYRNSRKPYTDSLGEDYRRTDEVSDYFHEILAVQFNWDSGDYIYDPKGFYVGCQTNGTHYTMPTYYSDSFKGTICPAENGWYVGQTSESKVDFSCNDKDMTSTYSPNTKSTDWIYLGASVLDGDSGLNIDSGEHYNFGSGVVMYSNGPGVNVYGEMLKREHNFRMTLLFRDGRISTPIHLIHE